MDNLEIDYKKAAQQLRSGEALFGKDGALAPLLERNMSEKIQKIFRKMILWMDFVCRANLISPYFI